MNSRRLIGPTIITLLSTGLLVDYVFFRDSWWSVVKLLTKIATILFGIFTSVFNVTVIGWIDKVSMPVLTLVVGIALVSIVVARAKNAMSKATPHADTPLIEAIPKTQELTQPTTSDATLSTTLGGWPWSGLLVKFTCAFVAVAALFGLAVCIIVYTFFWRASEKDLEARADAIAIGIRASSVGQRLLPNISKLNDNLSKYAAGDLIAYIYIDDADGQIVAHAPVDLSSHLRRDIPGFTARAIGGIEANYKGGAIFEVAKRLDGGRRLHIAFRQGLIEAEARRVLSLIAVSIFAILILAVVFFYVYVKHSITRPFFELVEHANRISKGEFAIQLDVNQRDELGEIARSLERLRSSLRAMLTRLEQRTLSRQ